MEHAMVNINNVEIEVIFTRVRMWIDGRTVKQTNRIHKNISTMLDIVKKNIKE